MNSLKNWSWRAINAQRRLIIELCKTARGKADRHGYVRLSFWWNKELFAACKEFGFFEFHNTNKTQQTIYLHQVVKYVSGGYKLLRNGECCRRGEREIHHLDHDPSNNQPSNLVYVSPLENKLLSFVIGGWSYSSTLGHCSTNFKALLHATIQATARRCGLEPKLWYAKTQWRQLLTELLKYKRTAALF